MSFSKRETVAAVLLLMLVVSARASSPVWRVTNTRGQLLYLAGSMHALRSVDYPLPPQFNRAFDESSRLAFEVDPGELQRSSDSLLRSGKYPAGDSLKNHVDPRTYAYVKRVFDLLRVPEDKFSRYRPWLLSLGLDSPAVGNFSGDLGIEEFLTRRARANRKSTSGLESAREHADVFAGLNDAQAEATLLLTFIPRAGPSGAGQEMMSAWRRGDADFLWHAVHDAYSDYPALGERLLEDRNRKWMPKIEAFLSRGPTAMVVVGAAHMGGPQGLLALLRARGYRVEQL